MTTFIIDGKEIKFSKEQFEDYTHRFKIQFEVGEPFFSSIDLYTTTYSYEDVAMFIESKKTKKVLDFKIVHRASKEQDERVSKFIEETLKDI